MLIIHSGHGSVSLPHTHIQISTHAQISQELQHTSTCWCDGDRRVDMCSVFTFHWEFDPFLLSVIFKFGSLRKLISDPENSILGFSSGVKAIKEPVSSSHARSWIRRCVECLCFLLEGWQWNTCLWFSIQNGYTFVYQYVSWRTSNERLYLIHQLKNLFIYTYNPVMMPCLHMVIFDI